MDSREEQLTPHQPLLSSLVVRPSDSGGGSIRVGGRSDYDRGEVRRERFSGYRSRELSLSPVHRRDVVHRYSPDQDFDHPGGERHHVFSSRNVFRSPDRHRNLSPHYLRGDGRPSGRGFESHGLGLRPLRGEGGQRNNPNVRPREGDWYCPDLRCGNLNFARRECCNSCGRHRNAPVGSPRRGHGAPPHSLGGPRRFPGPTMDRSPARFTHGFRSPPRGWPRDGFRDFGHRGMPPPRLESTFPDHDIRRERLDYPVEDFRGRGKFDRFASQDWIRRERTNNLLFDDRKGYERRAPSPLPPPSHRGRWIERDVRERSRSPFGSGPPKDFRRDVYMEQGRDERRGSGRDRISNVY